MTDLYEHSDLNTSAEDLAFMMRLIREIVDECPRRVATSQSERRAQDIVDRELQRAGLKTDFEAFEFNDSLYRNVVLHFGIGLGARAISKQAPFLAAALHALVATSYWADSTRRGYLLRRLLRFRPSQNLIASSPAKEEKPTLRVVLVAHADASYTGLLFHPRIVQTVIQADLPDGLRFLKRAMNVATVSQAVLGGVALVRGLSGQTSGARRAAEWALTLPTLFTFLSNLEIVLRDEVVPGANDNLTGCAALPVLARRLLVDQPDDVEYVFVVTGAEEASLGGSDALARLHADHWDSQNTVIIGVDTLSNGELRFIEREGEVSPRRIDGRLRRALQLATRSHEAFRLVRGLDVPVGGSDALPFMHRGYPATTVTCVDPEIGAARHYHLPTDTPEEIDERQFARSVDFVEATVRSVVDVFRTQALEV